MSYYFSDTFWTPWTIRLVMFFAVWQALSFFLLVYVFPNENLSVSKWVKFLVIPIATLTSVLTLTTLVFSDVKVVAGSPPVPTPAPGIAIFALTAISLVIGGVIIMIKKTRSDDSKVRAQTKPLLYGFLLMFVLIIVCNFILAVLFNVSSFVPLGALFILPFIVFTFYAIAKHELLNIKIVTTEILTFVLVITAFVEIILSSSFTEIIFRSGVFIALMVFGVLLIRSIMREVEHREKLQVLSEKLKIVDKQKDEFVSMAAHELRAPMTAIKGYLSMIMEGDAGEITEKARGFLADASVTNERLIRLVNNMLNVSRIEEGRMVYQIEKDNMSTVVKSVFAQFTPEAARKGLEFKLNIPREIKDMVEVDSDRLQEVIANLLSNAVKYTEKGLIEVRLKQPNPNTVRFEVEDTGPGISDVEQAKLFQKFARAESSVGKTTGTGLGLYICKLLMKKFDGKIGLISKEGKGSTFWFELPLVKEESKK